MWVYLARYRRRILADCGVLVLRTPTGMPNLNPSIADHTSKPTEIVGNVGAKDNVMTTFVITTHGTSNTSGPSPILVSQAMTANARPDSPTTKGLPKSGQDHVTCQRIDEFPAWRRRDYSSGSAVEHSPCRRRPIPAGRLAGSSQTESRQQATTGIPSCSHKRSNRVMMPRFRVAMTCPCVMGRNQQPQLSRFVRLGSA